MEKTFLVIKMQQIYRKYFFKFKNFFLWNRMQEGTHQYDAAPRISQDPCITEGLKIVSARKDGGREGVPVPWSHGDKRISEWSSPALF